MRFRKLILITHNYPYGNGETFLETEINFLAREFEEIKIISKNVVDEERREVPQNVVVSRFNPRSSLLKKFVFPFFIFTRLHKLLSDFFLEYCMLKKSYSIRLSFSRLKVLLHFMAKGLEFSRYLQKEIEKEATNCIIYSYWLDSNAYALTFIKKKNFIVKTVARAHSGEIYFNRSKTEYQPLLKLLSDGLNEIYFVSRNGKDYFLNKIGKNENLNHLKLGRLGISNRESRIFPKRQNNKFLIVSCSNLLPVKRVDLIIEALSLFQDEIIEWVHIGDGPEYNGLNNKANKLLRHNKNLNFKFPGFLSNREVLEFYEKNIVSLIINVSASEGIPVSIMEAFSFGIPAIATNVGGTAELVNNSNGIMLSSKPTSTELYEAIRYFYHLGESEMKGFKENAFYYWKNNFNSSNYIEFTKMLGKTD